MGSPCIATRACGSRCSPQVEKARAQWWRPSTVRNQFKVNRTVSHLSYSDKENNPENKIHVFWSEHLLQRQGYMRTQLKIRRLTFEHEAATVDEVGDLTGWGHSPVGESEAECYSYSHGEGTSSLSQSLCFQYLQHWLASNWANTGFL